MEHVHTPKALLWEKWINLLRSGTYQQGYMRLKHWDREGTPNYCCLGVVAEGVLGRQFILDETGRPIYYAPDGQRGEVGTTNGACSTNLGEDDLSVMGLDKELTESDREKLEAMGYDGGTGHRYGICMWFNDGENMSFVDIAEALEELGWNKDDADSD